MRIVFMGTPEIAATILSGLSSSEHEVTGVFCQPDKPRGRKREPMPPEVKVCALESSFPVRQPRSLRSKCLAWLTEWNPDLIVVAAYGRILPRAILELPPLGCINVHASLLPAYRGAAPIQWAIADGCTETGVTVMQMDEGLDTGNILTQQIVPISETETADSLHDKLSTAGTELLLKTLPGIAAGTIHSTPQNSAQATDAPILSRSDGHIDFTWDGQRIANRVRGFHPWPGTLCSWREKTLKFHPFVVPLPGPQSSLPGTILEVSKQGLTIACGDGAVLVTEVQLEGKRRMDAFSFAMGARLKPGELFKQVHR